ncbi:ATP-dependent Clp protease proteolytic subunit, partial [Candidatus Kuenenbacteria bacterium]|nr:ATP-dependent Clp protease proteolytic subunit [Candidatus Kuenenbacteria bacterium]
IKINAQHILDLKERLNKILSEHTGKPLEQIDKDTDRDFFMDAYEAKKYGVIDKVITK